MEPFYIKVKVKVKQKREEVKKVNDSTFEISVKEPAERNLANKRVIELLKQEYNQPVSIINGQHHPIKLFKIGR